MGIEMRLFTNATPEVQARWEAAIEARWNNVYKLRVAGATEADAAEDYNILCDVQFVPTAEGAHYSVNAQDAGATSGGRAGVGGTTSMVDWGTTDTTDITHEFGHMLGAVDNYFTSNGVDHTHGGSVAGFRDAGGGVMNNPADAPFREHFEIVRRHAATLLGVPAGRCSVV